MVGVNNPRSDPPSLSVGLGKFLVNVIMAHMSLYLEFLCALWDSSDV